MIGRRAGNAADNFTAAEPAEDPVYAFARQAPPIEPQGGVGGGMADHGRRPFNRVDFGDQRSVDQTCLLEILLI
jgi:hypothetical protein